MYKKSPVKEDIVRWKVEKKAGLHQNETLRMFCDQHGYNYITAKQY